MLDTDIRAYLSGLALALEPDSTTAAYALSLIAVVDPDTVGIKRVAGQLSRISLILTALYSEA